MNWKQATIIFFVCLIVFLLVLVLRQMPYGFDSYYYLNIVCNGAGFVSAEPILSKTIFSLLPCNVPFLLGINFILLYSCCLLGSLLGQHFLPKNGWLAGIFVCASLIVTMSFFSIESEPFAYFFCLAGAWLFYSGNWPKKIVGIALVLLATQFWLGSLIMLAAFCLSSIILFPFLFIAILFSWKNILGQFLPNFLVQENLPGFGLWYQGLLLVSFLYLKELKTVFIPTTFFILLAFVNMKFAFFAGFYLAILAAKQVSLENIGLLRWLPYAGVVLCTLFLWATAASLPPNQYELDAVQLAVQEAQGETICNQWGYGHLIEFYGGIPSDKAGGEQQCTACSDCIMLTFMEPPGCILLKGELESNRQIKVYKC